MSIIFSFRSIENKHNVYRGKVLPILKRARNKIIDFKKKKMKLLTKEQQGSYENANICYICKEKFQNKYLKDKKYHLGRDHYHYTENIEVLHM